MQMKVDNARSFVSIARKEGHSIWIDETVERVRIWPGAFDAIMARLSGAPLNPEPYWLRVSNGNVFVFTDEVCDLTDIWDAYEKKHGTRH
jgi:hypothetical protein